MTKVVDCRPSDPMDLENAGEAENESSAFRERRELADRLERSAFIEGDDTDTPLAHRQGSGAPIGALMAARLRRRSFLSGAAAVLPIATLAPSTLLMRQAHAQVPADSLTFYPLEPRNDPRLESSQNFLVVPQDYEWYPILRWGDSLYDDTPDLDTRAITDRLDDPDNPLTRPGAAADQARRYGYNCDAVEFFAIDDGEDDDDDDSDDDEERRPGRRGLLRGRRLGRNGEGESSDRAVICVNHEFVNANLVYPGIDDFGGGSFPLSTEFEGYFDAAPEMAGVIKSMVGVSVAEIALDEEGRWKLEKTSRLNRRITLDTSFEFSGPARGAEFLRTSNAPHGLGGNGTYNNCASGATPWKTYLTCEENTDQLFANFDALVAGLDLDNEEDLRLFDAHRRLAPFGGASALGLEFVEDRFDTTKDPHQPFHFSWVKEIDPFDPEAPPVARTALGRFKHEGAATIVAPGRQLVVYMGDDARFEYLYKFVSRRRVNTRTGNDRGLRKGFFKRFLDYGTLYVARFDESGRGEWLPLDLFDRGEAGEKLRAARLQRPVFDADGNITAFEDTEMPQFRHQSEVLINARRAGDILGATPMDRPEDVEANPVTRKVYMALTNNTRRDGDERGFRDGRFVSEQADLSNPREVNAFGHIIEITEDGNDNAATGFSWEIFMLCGDPLDPAGLFLKAEDFDQNEELPLSANDTFYAGFDPADRSLLAPIGSPDNIGFDSQGNMLLITDGGQPLGTNNGGFFVPTEGPTRGFLRQFMSAPRDSEVCGGEFTPDDRTLFLNIQHPGDSGSIASPVSSWPTLEGPVSNRSNLPQPQPTLVGIRRRDGRRVGE